MAKFEQFLLDYNWGHPIYHNRKFTKKLYPLEMSALYDAHGNLIRAWVGPSKFETIPGRLGAKVASPSATMDITNIHRTDLSRMTLTHNHPFGTNPYFTTVDGDIRFCVTKNIGTIRAVSYDYIFTFKTDPNLHLALGSFEQPIRIAMINSVASTVASRVRSFQDNDILD
ncbi:MAG: hypothetical protein MUF87_20370 [Anaerolineae bacterium]|nr:hypothetical protein [Anaerolineae bacterium]